MAQVNVSYDDRLVIALDRIAIARGQARPDLLRCIAHEAVEAHDAGRLAFQRDAAPRLDSSINGLAVQLREAVIELERTQRVNQKHEQKLLGAWSGSEEAVRAAQENLVLKINDINRKSYQPFVGKLKEIHEKLDTSEERALAALQQELAAIHAQLDIAIQKASEPRTQHNLILGDDRTLSAKFLAMLMVPVGLMFITLFLLLAQQMQSAALSLTSGLINSDERLCRLINRRYGVDDCNVPDEDRLGAVKVIKAIKAKP